MSQTKIQWRGETPLSAQFDDIYFQPDNGLEESRHVFLAGNDFPERLIGKDKFVIAELGFGTGLNFLATWHLWQKQPQPPALHYIAIELYPLLCEDLFRALKVFSELSYLSEMMIANYPNDFQHNWQWQVTPNIQLTVLWGDAAKRIADIPASADAWFLDGFNPANNPELWSQNIFNQIAKRSKIGTTFATFTVARLVRDHAEQAGFQLQKRKGFGKKRDMLTGVFNG